MEGHWDQNNERLFLLQSRSRNHHNSNAQILVNQIKWNFLLSKWDSLAFIKFICIIKENKFKANKYYHTEEYMIHSILLSWTLAMAGCYRSALNKSKEVPINKLGSIYSYNFWTAITLQSVVCPWFCCKLMKFNWYFFIFFTFFSKLKLF